MKKLFTFMFLFSVICPVISTELWAENLSLNKEITNTVNQTVQDELNNQNKLFGFGKRNPKDNRGNLIKVIKFNNDIGGENEYGHAKNFDGTDTKKLSNECIAVVIDDSWAIASKKCALSKGDVINRTTYKVTSVSISNFSILLNKGKKPEQDNWVDNINADQFGNFILLRAVNENQNPLFSGNAKANLAFSNTEELDTFKEEFKEGTFEVNKTEWNRYKLNGVGDEYEEDCHPYYDADRETFGKEIIGLRKDNATNNVLAQVSSSVVGAKLLRAGDPLFYVKNGKRYLLGFGSAVNLWDGMKNTRSDKVILITESDVKNIIKRIREKDPAAAERIEKNILTK